MCRDPLSPLWDPEVCDWPHTPPFLAPAAQDAASEQSTRGANGRVSCTQEHILPASQFPQFPSTIKDPHQANAAFIIPADWWRSHCLPSLIRAKGQLTLTLCWQPSHSNLQHSFPGQGSKTLFSTGTLAGQLGKEGRKLGRTLQTTLWSHSPHAPLPWAVLAPEAV